MNKEEIEEIETLEIDFNDTDELELALEVSSKKAIYLIDDLIKHLFELQQENKKLNGAIQTYDILLKANTEENKKYKEVIEKSTNELFILKDMIYKPETREENFEIQRKISSIIKRLNGKEVE